MMIKVALFYEDNNKDKDHKGHKRKRQKGHKGLNNHKLSRHEKIIAWSQIPQLSQMQEL